MKSVRDAILLGTRGAAETHDALQVREQVEKRGAPVDVFEAIQRIGAFLLFRPLEGLLGACVSIPEARTGIMVTTRRGLHMQRFTAAHELGHFILEHEGSLDREVRFPGQTSNRDLKEIAADAFAAEFLMPKWLFRYHAKNHEWSTQRLSKPVNVYQLSLRLGVSYEATCLGLQGHKILDAPTVESLRNTAPKRTKQLLLGDVTPEDWRAHVWKLDEHDDGAMIQAGPDDLFVAELAERSGSGYLWDTEVLEEAGFEVVKEYDDQRDPNAVGGPSLRRLILKGPPPGLYELSLSERRPWEVDSASLKSLAISVSTFGAESEGIPRRSRRTISDHLVN